MENEKLLCPQKILKKEHHPTKLQYTCRALCKCFWRISKPTAIPLFVILYPIFKLLPIKKAFLCRSLSNCSISCRFLIFFISSEAVVLKRTVLDKILDSNFGELFLIKKKVQPVSKLSNFFFCSPNVFLKVFWIKWFKYGLLAQIKVNTTLFASVSTSSSSCFDSKKLSSPKISFSF